MSNIKSLRDQPNRRRRTGPLPQPERAVTGELQFDGWAPPSLRQLEDTGLSKLAVADLILKALYFRGDLVGHQIAEVLRLPFNGVLDSVVEFLKREKLIEVLGSGGIGEASYRYAIASKGIERAIDALQRTMYAGAAPVPLNVYIESLKAQNRKDRLVKEQDMLAVMENLIVSKDMLDKIGPAANSGTSIFLYGPPGNGKTTMSEAIGRAILGDDMWIPYAVDVDGQIIQVFDSVNHELSDNQTPLKYGTGSMADPRWVRIKRPVIVVGGELTMESLDLIYDPINKFYEAPYQVKANGGLFLIDDFGRQQVRPQELLNRWIVPLEKKYDFLTLNNGRKIEIPFNVLIIFSTNMDPKDLVDDAFLRRIKYKIEVGNPTLDQYRELFELMCRIKNIPFDKDGMIYLIKEWYRKFNRDLRFVHPRDILSQMVDIASYLGRPVTMADTDLIDRAAESYFVEL
ncbi:ATP-binding protein [Phototrophicus methaneseepsis]|uniref:ATP-binding protein n=1 Tax=Phototrophicus methaneseepsis TaxID=2710758 RepID=A0A7S8E6V9_9CHLR|nr:ATP-binding protein [Phototrophicus methaneseepsis]QPC81459.1 ATP-binding protein [Phototrophicus methaneseepsis]